MNFFNTTNGDVMSLKEDGTLFVKVLTITGGGDLAEPFKISEKDLPKGSVVIIDEEHPGHLKLSTEPYDRRVAGVISGAGGVNPGVKLSQRGVLEGDQQVALTGRVYVQADAGSGAIRPGDLLTTSTAAGHAMKVADFGRAQGAVLGKAMTGLKEGRGLVGMRERVKHVGGSLLIESQPGQGVQVSAELPVTPQGKEEEDDLHFISG